MDNRFKRWLSIKKDQNARGILLLGIVLFNIFLWFFSSIAAYIIAPTQYDNIIAALWESGITWMLEPGFYDPTVPYAIRIISIIVIVTSMITFTGGIIGYVGNLFSSIIDQAKEGKNKLYLYDHVVILNWNHKALELIADYQFDDQTTTVVVLSSESKEKIEENISRKLYLNPSSKKKIDILIREGEVFSKSDLMKICIEDAKSIIILSDENQDQGVVDQDMLSIKTLMLIAKLNLKKDQTIIVEVKEQKSSLLIRDYIAKYTQREDQILPILPDELMGRLIAQTLLMPELNKVYQELFSFEGVEFYNYAFEDAKTYMETHHQAIPIYTHKHSLYVLADNQKSIDQKRSIPMTNYIKLDIKDQSRYQEKQIVIFGKNRKLPYILDSIALYEKENQTKIHVAMFESNDAKAIENYTTNLEHIDHILILSADDLSPEAYDSDVLMTLLMTQQLAKRHGAEIIIELLDPRHFDIAQGYNVKNTIISNEYISRLMTQLSKNRNLYDLFMDLLTYDPLDSETETYEVYTYQAKDLLSTPLPLTFSSKAEAIYSFYRSGNEDYILIGMIKNHQLDMFSGNLDEKSSLVIDKDDYVVVICK